jgi:peptide deformylase
MIDIVQKGDPVLRSVAKEISTADFGSKKLNDIIARMRQALREQEDAVAIAAPQIGEPIRLFVVSGKVLAKNYPDIEKGDVIPVDLVCANPEIMKLSRKKQPMTEGCLSIRWLYGTVERAAKTLMKAQDENGITFTRGGAGLLSQIFQHEIDHLNGILFIDTATDLEDSPPEDDKK